MASLTETVFEGYESGVNLELPAQRKVASPRSRPQALTETGRNKKAGRVAAFGVLNGRWLGAGALCDGAWCDGVLWAASFLGRRAAG